MIKQFNNTPQPPKPFEENDMNFKKLKQFGIIYIIGKNNKINEYNFNKLPGVLFQVSENSFSDGFGGRWRYEDYNITWSDNELVLYKRSFENLRQKAENFDNILNALTIISDDHLKNKVISAYLNGFYGTMYGCPFYEDKIIKIEKASSIGIDGTLCFVWGWPGPDFNTYKPEDYGKTWALTKEELAKL